MNTLNTNSLGASVTKPFILRSITKLYLFACVISLIFISIFLQTSRQDDPGQYWTLGLMMYVLTVFPLMLIMSLVSGNYINRQYSQSQSMSFVEQVMLWISVVLVVVSGVILPGLMAGFMPLSVLVLTEIARRALQVAHK